jgi:hypothetical protein
VAAAGKAEVGGDVPARQVDMRLCACELIGDARECFRTVDENFQRVPRPRERLPICPAARGRVKGRQPADLGEAAAVMGCDRFGNPVAQGAVDAQERTCRCWRSLQAGDL